MRIEEIILSPYDEGIEFCVIGKADDLIPFGEELEKKLNRFNRENKGHYIIDLDFSFQVRRNHEFPDDAWLNAIIGKDVSEAAYKFIEQNFIIPLVMSAWTANKPTGYFKLFMEEE